MHSPDKTFRGTLSPLSYHDPSFITTDNPVTVFMPMGNPLVSSEINLVGSVLLFPLTPQFCLLLIHPESENGEADKFQKIKIMPHETEKICIRLVGTVTKEYVELINTVLTVHSDRLLIGNDSSILTDIYKKLKKDFGWQR